MELICPECRGALQPTSGKMVVCPLHGGEYEVLFDRAAAIEAATAPPPRADVPPAPASETAEPTTKTCPVCEVANPSGAPKCFACGHTFGLLSGLASPRPALRPTLPPDLKCKQHPDVAAVNRCKVCGHGVCATCDFTFAGNVHVCPTCVDAQSSAGISPERKRKMMWSLGLALWSTLLLAVMFTPLLYRFGDGKVNELVAGVLGIGVLVPTIIGTAMGFSAYDRRLRNPSGVVAAVWWNSVLLAFYLLLSIIGTLKR